MCYVERGCTTKSTHRRIYRMNALGLELASLGNNDLSLELTNLSNNDLSLELANLSNGDLSVE